MEERDERDTPEVSACSILDRQAVDGKSSRRNHRRTGESGRNRPAPTPSMPDLQLLRLDHAAAVLAFERENRAYFAAAVPDRGDEFFAEFDTRYAQLLAWQADGTDYFHLLVDRKRRGGGAGEPFEVVDGSAELGYRIARKAAGQGIGHGGGAQGARARRHEYGLTRLRARVTLDNPASRKVLEHNSFVAVGELTLNGKPAISYVCELR